MPNNSQTRCVGDWFRISTLGQGGFGEVQHWNNRSTNQEIAIKRIKNAENMSIDQQRKLEQRWWEELKWTLEIQDSTCIVHGIKLGNDSREFIEYLTQDHFRQLPPIILQYCNGGDVRKLLRQPRSANGLQEFEVREILSSLRQAVDFLHTHCKLCHRDLKPDNIVIHRLSNGRRQYKLTDFGLSRETPDKTILQSVVGTRHYYAPEVIVSGVYNKKVDYWALGIIAYELATGVLPFLPHQTPINIHENLNKKARNCIAITEDHLQAMHFHFHSEIPVGHHLSQPWATEFTRWLPLALDTNYSRRGVAIDEVQTASPFIFTEIDRMVKMPVLTIFAACCSKRLEYEVTSSMTMQQLCMLIEKSTDLPTSSTYFVLPTGHPHKRLTPQSKPMDLYVEDWCDSSEQSRNPPVMVYIFNVTKDNSYVTPIPYMPPLLQYYMNSNETNFENWISGRLILDLHHVITTEQAYERTLVFGFKEYAMSLEHDILESMTVIKSLDKAKDMCCFAIEHFQALLTAAQKQHKFHLHNDEEWQSNLMKVMDKYKENFPLVAIIKEHYESTLRCVRDNLVPESQEIYNSTIKSDKYHLKNFQKKYLINGDAITYSELNNIAIRFARTRPTFFGDTKLKNLRESLHKMHFRFNKTLHLRKNVDENLGAIRIQLLQLQLQMLPSANQLQQASMLQLNDEMSRLSFTAADDKMAASLDSFDSPSTRKVIDETDRICELLKSSMDIDRCEQS